MVWYVPTIAESSVSRTEVDDRVVTDPISSAAHPQMSEVAGADGGVAVCCIFFDV